MTIHKLPFELQSYIYKFINPISKVYTANLIQNYNWCYKCGEYINYDTFLIKVVTNKIEYKCLNCFNFGN